MSMTFNSAGLLSEGYIFELLVSINGTLNIPRLIMSHAYMDKLVIAFIKYW